jgi:hypothetical protein
MAHTSCLVSIDCFRGFAVLAIVLASYLFGTEDLPAWLRHAPDGKLTAVDFGAHLFIIAIGIAIGLTFGGALQRCPIIFAIGFAMAQGQIALGRNTGSEYWGVLLTITVTLLLALPTLPQPKFRVTFYPRCSDESSITCVTSRSRHPSWVADSITSDARATATNSEKAQRAVEDEGPYGI